MKSKADFPALIAHLERFPLRSKKRKDYEIWLPIVQVYLSGRGAWVPKMEWIKEQCRRLKRARDFDERAVRDAEASLGEP
jgi:uncharacterized protein (UPF0297 family)